MIADITPSALAYIEAYAAAPKPAGTCWTCRWSDPGRCSIPAIDMHTAQWLDRYVDGRPAKNAPPCPGFEDKP